MTETSTRGRFAAILLRRCPRCKEGRVFLSPFVMDETCEVCGLRFGRGEPGYFTGAMYVSYALAIPIIALLTLVEYLLLPGWRLWQLVLLAWALCLPLIPWVWQYSRVIWVHFDRAIDPKDETEAP
jgi:uncharacterized protein (DUF983 family)